MVYGKRNRIVLEILNSVKPLWDLLKKIPAADWEKVSVTAKMHLAESSFMDVPIVCSAKHTSMNCAKQLSKAFVVIELVPMLFLSLGLQDSMTCDPGFYQVWTVLMTFRRMVNKQPHLLDMWQFCMDRYRGESSFGPFGKLLEIAETSGMEC